MFINLFICIGVISNYYSSSLQVRIDSEHNTKHPNMTHWKATGLYSRIHKKQYLQKFIADEP